MKIAVTVNFSPWSPYCGGGQRSAHNIACALSELGHDVTVVYTRGLRDDVNAPEVPYSIRWATMPVERSRVDAPLRPLSAVSVARHVATLRPEVVHANGEEAALLGPLKRVLGFLLVVTPRYPSFPPSFLRVPRPTFIDAARRWRRHTKYMMLARALRAADHWCPTSRSSGTTVQRAFGLSEADMTVVFNGIDRAFFEVDTPSERRREVIFFGRVAREKGVFDLVEALRILGDEAPACCIVGRGPATRAVRARVRRVGLAPRVEFVDWLAPTQLADRVASAGLAVLPSWEESFGNAVAEALAVGTPLVTTGVGSIPELAEHESTALLVPARRPQALAAAIRRLWDDPKLAHRLACAGRASARARFDWRRTALRYEAIYRQL